MSVLARGRHQERSLGNALRRESQQLDRTLRSLGVQYRRDLAGVCGAQLELRRALDKLGGGPENREGGQEIRARRSTTTAPPASTSNPTTTVVGAPKPRRGPRPVVVMTTTRPTPKPKPCCPNHIVCSACNLRLRLADAVTRRFTPGLWTMYCGGPLPPSAGRHGERGAVVYRMPGYVTRRNLSASDNSSRYLPFI